MSVSERNIVVIGGGFSGLASASILARDGYNVTLIEKNEQVGGRARSFNTQGFTFDMGPSWYWMPDVFEHYFKQFEKSSADFYDLVRLDPSYQVYYESGHPLQLPASSEKLLQLFEEVEQGAGKLLAAFLQDAQYKYERSMKEFIYKPSLKVSEFASLKLMKDLFKLNLLTSFDRHVAKYFKNKILLSILNFPILFLGALPSNTPAMYSLMNYADLVLGTWYPMGGMHKIIQGMERIARDQGVRILTGRAVDHIIVAKGKADAVKVDGELINCDAVIASADYQHVDSQLLEPQYRNYNEKYWDKKEMAPSCILYYVGVNKRLRNLKHHNLFFDSSFDKHVSEIYNNPQWPSDPLFYACVPSVTDASVAPEDCENLFLLIPVAPGLKDSEIEREKYFQMLIERLEQRTGQSIKEHIVYSKSYAPSDFVHDYNAFKGNAYGLSNVLKQTAFLKPKIKNKKVENLYYTGQLTVPGPGVPPSLISGQIVAQQVTKDLQL